MDRSALRSPGAARSRWLAELEQAIDEAQLLAWQLGVLGAVSAEALDLYCRLDAARDEVGKLRSGGWRAQQNEIYPNWTSTARQSDDNAFPGD